MLANFFFTQRLLRQWHFLPREAVSAPTLKKIKARLDGVPGSLICRGGGGAALPMAQGLELGDLEGLFQSKPFHDYTF